ncbi:hypothetical protein BTVI_76474 [Pitangus sulphuratus]|nr:hypothetical protein BTVI_76474 [Pitangus sulphuratus]
MKSSFLSLLCSKIAKPKVLICSSYNTPFSPLTDLVAVLWMYSETFTTFLNCEDQNCSSIQGLSCRCEVPWQIETDLKRIGGNVEHEDVISSLDFQSVFVLGNALTQIQDLVKLHEVFTGPALKPVKVFLEGPLFSLLSVVKMTPFCVFLEINVLQEQTEDGNVIVCMEVHSIQKSVASVKPEVCRKKDKDDHLTNRDRDKAEAFNAFFAFVFNADDGPRRSQCPELEDHDCENEQFPVDPEIVWDVLLQLDPYRSM